MDDQKTIVVSVHAKDCVDYQCRRCGQCCRHIKDSLMVESLDAYRLANYLRGCDPNICTIDDVLTRYCEPMPLTQECFPIFMLKTTGPDDSCIFLKDGLCSIYEARPRTCRLYPFSVGPGERGRDFEYCLCFDRNQQYHFNGGKVSVKDWFYRNFPRVEKEYLKQEYAAITEIGKRMRSISPELCKQMTFQVLFYRYYNFDLDQPFLEQYKQNTRLLLEKLAFPLPLDMLHIVYGALDALCQIKIPHLITLLIRQGELRLFLPRQSFIDVEALRCIAVTVDVVLKRCFSHKASLQQLAGRPQRTPGHCTCIMQPQGAPAAARFLCFPSSQPKAHLPANGRQGARYG